MTEYQQRALLKQLEDKATRQATALDATHAMIDVVRNTPLDKPAPRK